MERWFIVMVIGALFLLCTRKWSICLTTLIWYGLCVWLLATEWRWRIDFLYIGMCVMMALGAFVLHLFVVMGIPAIEEELNRATDD